MRYFPPSIYYSPPKREKKFLGTREGVEGGRENFEYFVFTSLDNVFGN